MNIAWNRHNLEPFFSNTKHCLNSLITCGDVVTDLGRMLIKDPKFKEKVQSYDNLIA